MEKIHCEICNERESNGSLEIGTDIEIDPNKGRQTKSIEMQKYVCDHCIEKIKMIIKIVEKMTYCGTKDCEVCHNEAARGSLCMSTDNKINQDKKQIKGIMVKRDICYYCAEKIKKFIAIITN